MHTTLSSSLVRASPYPVSQLTSTYGKNQAQVDNSVSVTPLPTVQLNLPVKEADNQSQSDTGANRAEHHKPSVFSDNSTYPLKPPNVPFSGRIRSGLWRAVTVLSNIVCSLVTNGREQLSGTSSHKNTFRIKAADFSWQLAVSNDSHTPAEVLHDIPDYVLEYAPLVHLYSKEQFWPCDIGKHLEHITPHLNYTPLRATREHPFLNDLDDLNNWQDGRYIFLVSDDNVERRPKWLLGRENIPTPSSGTAQPLDTTQTADSHKKDPRKGGRSKAPAVLVVIDKGDGIVDAFWFYFYSYNLGNEVINVRFGNHVGDWEHSLVRFHNGVPKAVFLSEHSGGEAYTYEALEKIGKRPVIYSATGTHAMYANPGTHAYILPWGLLRDRTDQGPLWDPALNLHAYTYSLPNDTLQTSDKLTPNAPTEWFYFRGHWGDKIYPLSDSRQYMFAGQYHYVSGPLGPRFKNLGRKKVCQGSDEEICIIRPEIGIMKKNADIRVQKSWDAGLGEDDSSEDGV